LDKIDKHEESDALETLLELEDMDMELAANDFGFR
jgi:hypothetical protein